jgi:hypothetical protein
MIFPQIRSHKGSATFELIVISGLLIFLLLFPPTIFSLNFKKALLEDTKAIALHYAAIEGGVTTSVKNLIISELVQKGFKEENIIIESNTDDANRKYKTDSDPVIVLTIKYPADTDIKLLNGLLMLVGYMPGEAGQKYYQVTGYIVSEKMS